MLTKVYKRLSKVLVLIMEGNGGNDLVETKRGKKFTNLDLEEVDFSNLPVNTNFVDIVNEEDSEDENDE